MAAVLLGLCATAGLPRRALVHGALVSPAIAAVDQRTSLPPRRYSLVPRGSIREKNRRLMSVTKDLVSSPEDAYLLGERAQLEYDLARLKENRLAVDRLAKGLREGLRYPARLTLPVPDVEAARKFWVDGLKMEELSRGRAAGGGETVVVGYGPETLATDDGGKFSLELLAAGSRAPPPVSSKGSRGVGLAYVQLCVPNVRISSLVDNGGRVESAYGYVEVIAPGGLGVRVLTAPRRDPFEFVAVRSSNVSAAAAVFQEALGFVATPAPPPRYESDGGVLGTGLLATRYRAWENVLAPRDVVGSVLVSSPAGTDVTTGVLLMPENAEDVPLGLGGPVPGGPFPEIHVASPGAGDAKLSAELSRAGVEVVLERTNGP